MAESGRTRHIRHLLQALFVLLIMVLPAPASQAWPWARERSVGNNHSVEIVSASRPLGQLQEVSPPGAVQQLKAALSSHTPRLQLISPSDGSLLNNGLVQISLRVEDWPLTEDPELGLGAHVAIQVDDNPPLRFGHSENNCLQISLPDLSPGSHRFTAYAAMPWGEAVKSKGASLQWRLNLLQELSGTQPDQDAPWLAMVSPSDLSSGNPQLIDWLVWNAPLQNLREGDGRWRLRISVNGDSFLVDRQEALWLKSAENGIGRVQMELLDGLGDPITPAFNNQLRATTTPAGAQPIWMLPRLSDAQMGRLLGEKDPETEQEPEQDLAQPKNASELLDQDDPAAETPVEDSSEVSDEDLTNPPGQKRIAPPTPAIGLDNGLPAAPEEALIDTGETPEASENEKTVEERESQQPEQTAKPEKLRVTSSLGGSARQLVNEDGTQR